MKISHHSGNMSIEGESSEKNTGFLLTNKIGGYMFFGAEKNFSKYNGIFYANSNGNDFELFKTIEDIRLIGSNPIEIKNKFHSIERVHEKGKEIFHMDDSNAITYDVEDFNGEVEIILDCRKMYDFSTSGRIYNIQNIDGKIVIEYRKYYSERLQQEDYKIFIAIGGIDTDIEKVNQWITTEYPYDDERESRHNEAFVYNAFKFKVENEAKLAITFGHDMNEVIKKNDFVKRFNGMLKDGIKDRKTQVKKTDIRLSEKYKLAYKASKISLHGLHNRIGRYTGIYAGLPWFHQYWTRDEAISLGAYIEEGEFKTAKEILFRHLNLILHDGRIGNRWPHSELGSADGVGWIFKRIYDLLKQLEKKNKFYDHISSTDLVYIKDKLSFCIENLLKNYTQDGLAFNHEKETWMDTSYGGDTRSGFRIEIQALRLNMYKLMRYICHITQSKELEEKYKDLEIMTRHKVRDEFLINGMLYDGKDDTTIRPNIFLAHYIYPDLLTDQQWEICFDHALGSLWLEWGGLTTIGKKNPLFSPDYTGENNKSYHRGDSWFFVNNISAISLYNVNKHKYGTKINKIISASANDLLFLGAIGHSSEVSSASHLSAKGSLVQAWSAGTFMELMKVVYHY